MGWGERVLGWELALAIFRTLSKVLLNNNETCLRVSSFMSTLCFHSLSLRGISVLCVIKAWVRTIHRFLSIMPKLLNFYSMFVLWHMRSLSYFFYGTFSLEL